MVKFYYPDGTHCYRALHTFHAVYTADDGRLIARTTKPNTFDQLYEFEIAAFELVEAGVRLT